MVITIYSRSQFFQVAAMTIFLFLFYTGINALFSQIDDQWY